MPFTDRTELPRGGSSSGTGLFIDVNAFAAVPHARPASKPWGGRSLDVPVDAHTRPLLDERRPGGGACGAGRRLRSIVRRLTAHAEVAPSKPYDLSRAGPTTPDHDSGSQRRSCHHASFPDVVGAEAAPLPSSGYTMRSFVLCTCRTNASACRQPHSNPRN